MLHVAGSLVLAHSLRLAADMPFAVVESGSGTVLSGQRFAPPDRGGAAISPAQAARRARAVRQHGIAKARLYSQGFGAERPIDTNATEEARKNNRRVELHIEKEGDAASAAPPRGTPPRLPRTEE